MQVFQATEKEIHAKQDEFPHLTHTMAKHLCEAEQAFQYVLKGGDTRTATINGLRVLVDLIHTIAGS